MLQVQENRVELLVPLKKNESDLELNRLRLRYAVSFYKEYFYKDKQPKRT